MSEAARWYVIHTYSGYENKVAQNIEKVVENRRLHELIPEVRVPTETVTVIKDGKEETPTRKVFPCYVLVKMIMTDESWYVVRNTRGVTGFVGPASKPIALTDEEVEALDVYQEEQGEKKIEIHIAVGDNVEILAGPLIGMNGIVRKIDVEQGIAEVGVSVFGRETPGTISIVDIKKLKN